MARVLLCHDPVEDRPILDIALSERNLIALLSKLYTPGSTCSFTNGDVPEQFAFATFRVEPDALHYAYPTRDGAPPGPMHPIAEFVQALVRDVLADMHAANHEEARGQAPEGFGAALYGPRTDGSRR